MRCRFAKIKTHSCFLFQEKTLEEKVENTASRVSQRYIDFVRPFTEPALNLRPVAHLDRNPSLDVHLDRVVSLWAHEF